MSEGKGVKMHLIIDGFGANRKMLESEDIIYDLLDRYPSQIGMTKVAPPQVFKYVGSKPEDWGISGFVLIAESHISIHTFPDRCYVNIDIFSCKDFDSEYAIQELKAIFEFDEIQKYLLNRGLEYSNVEVADLKAT
ncbi:MAG: S-adenosylmethionine decarboxylase [Dehalococcoidia bacterium]|nr:S-adenosylmethionine decarboxylase [Dehalococcoidia bacterium]